MKMKKIVAIMLTFAMTASVLTGCGAKTKPSNNSQSSENVNLLFMSANEKEGNVLRDQLTKAGFNVTLNIQPDYSSYVTVLDSGEFDMAIGGWTTVTGNPDYAVKSLFKSDGDSNRGPINDEVIDSLIEKASSETPDVYVNTYKELEDRLVTEKAYIAPLFATFRIHAFNKDLIQESSVKHPKSRSLPWELFSYNDTSLNATRPLVMTQTMGTLTSLHPIRGNDGSINQLNSNMYIRLVNLTDEDEITADGSLSYDYAIGEGNQEYFFLLRDDVNFAKIEDKKAVDTGVRVGAEDVIYSLDLAKDKTSVPTHKTYTLHEAMEKIEAVTDIESLKNTKVTGSDKTVFDVLSENAPQAIASLTEDKTAVNNAAGTYQVVKVTTVNPFPQVLNFLAHQSAGIVSKEQVSKINGLVDMENYDMTKDVLYGDQSAVTEGPTYNNHLWLSGPYAMTYKNDYEAVFQKNPAYMVGTEYEPRVTNIVCKFIKDNDSAAAALRSGEIDFLPFVTEDKVSIIEAEPNIHLSKRSSNGVSYVSFNLREGNKFANEDLRKAALYAINQDDYIAVFNGLKGKVYSTLSTIIDTGNELHQDLNKSKEHMAKYQEANK